MILQYGDVSKLVGKNWNIVEIRSEGGCEGTIRRIGRELASIFKGDPVELFVPVGKRDLQTFEIKTETYIFVRSLDPKKIVQLRQVTGVVWTVCQGQGTSVNRLIYLDDLYIQELIKQAEEEFNKRAEEVTIHSFCRILDGYTRDYCGEVIGLEGDRAQVLLKLKTLDVLVETPIHNLLVVHPHTEKAKVFYYRDLLDEYHDEYPDEPEPTERLEGLANEGASTMPVVRTQTAVTAEPSVSKRFSKQHTATALVLRSIAEGVTDPQKLVAVLVDSINSATTRPVKNITILVGVIQAALTKTLHEKNPKIKTYRDVIALYGDSYRIDPVTIGTMIPWIPIKTDPSNIKPRRSRRVTPESGLGTTVILSDNLPPRSSNV